jgi:hypothetical protein
MAKTTLRIPDDLYAKVEEIAEQERRSINAQLLVLIERAVKDASDPH